MAKIQTITIVFLLWLVFGFFIPWQNTLAGEKLIGFVVTNASFQKQQLTCSELNYLVRFNKLAQWWSNGRAPIFVLYSAPGMNHRMITMNCFQLMPANFANMLVARGYKVQYVEDFPYGLNENYMAFSEMGAIGRSKRIKIVE